MNFIEDEKTELKLIYTIDIKKEIVAFLNTSGGIIYIGVQDDGKVIGVDKPNSIIESITQIIHEAIRPDASLICFAEQIVVENKIIVRLEIGKGVKKPYYIYEKGIKPSGVYVRVNNTCQQASEYAIKQMIIMSNEKPYELMTSQNQRLTFNYLEEAFKTAEVELKMKSLYLINSENLYTNLALLLSNECPFSIKIAVFDSDDKSSFVDRKEFFGSLIKQVDDAYEYLKLNNKVKGEYDNLTRKDKQDYDNLVLREGLLNSVIHRDYSLNGNIIISIYNNRLEYVSIGGLVNGMTYKDMMLGVSRSRNENLANVFFKINYVEAYGTGIEKILGAYKKTFCKPKIEISDNGFLLTLPNKNYKNNQILEIDKEEEVFEFIQKNGKVSRLNIEINLNIKTTQVLNYLKTLIELDKIIKIGQGKNTFYIVK